MPHANNTSSRPGTHFPARPGHRPWRPGRHVDDGCDMTTSHSSRRRALPTRVGVTALAIMVLLTVPLKLIDEKSQLADVLWAIQMAALLVTLAAFAVAVARWAAHRRNRGVVA